MDFRIRSRENPGIAGVLWQWAPVVAVAAALPLVLGEGLAGTVSEPAAQRVALVALFVRVALLLAGFLSLGTFDLVVRGPDRGVVDLHPILARAYVRSRLVAAARGAAPALVAALVTLLPAWQDPALLGSGALLLGGSWAAGITLGMGVNLAAPSLAVRPGVAPVLDALRGPNPRAQAALIWAPAAALFVAGLAILAATAGLELAFAGNPAGYSLLALPWAAAAFGARAAFADADTLARIPAVLGEVESAYAAVEAAEEGHRVYLEWVVRWAPAWLRPELLRVLRHGWRAERGWLGASFLAAGLAGLAAWSDRPGSVRGVLLTGVLLAGVAALGPRLRARDPAWLVLVLPAAGRRLAVGLAILAWGQVIVFSVVAALTVRQGLAIGALSGLRLELVLLGLALAGARLPAAGYVPAAVLVCALGVAW